MITKRNLLVCLIVVGAVVVLPVVNAISASDVVDHDTFILTPKSKTKAPNADGFIQLWTILEPLRATQETQNAVQQTVKAQQFEGQFTVVPKNGDTVTAGGQQYVWHSVDTNKYNINLHYFANAYGKSPTSALFWAVAIVDCPNEVKDARLAIGSNSASVWWVNGKEVIGIYGNRQTVVDDGVSKRLTLKKGRNIIRGAIVNASGAADFCARILDKDGKPLKNCTVVLE